MNATTQTSTTNPQTLRTRGHRRARALLAAPLTATFVFVGAFGLANPAYADQPGTVSGTVRALNGAPVSFAKIDVDNADIGNFARTDANGHYALASELPGPHTIRMRAACMDDVTTTINVNGNVTQNFVAVNDRDAFGHVCQDAVTNLAPSTSTVLPLTGDDKSFTTSLPFGFLFYGKTKSQVDISTNGYVTFTTPDAGAADFLNGPLLDPSTPRDGIFPFWDDLVIDSNASVRTGTTGTAPNRQFAIEWRNAEILATGDRLTIDLVLSENGTITMAWHNVGVSNVVRGQSATIGIRDSVANVGGQAVTRSINTDSVFDGLTSTFLVDHSPVANAGPDLKVGSGASFTLDGTKSTDPDGTTGLSFAWAQASGPATTIQDPKKAKTTVSGVKGAATLEYRLTVIDPFGQVSNDFVTVNVAAPK